MFIALCETQGWKGALKNSPEGDKYNSPVQCAGWIRHPKIKALNGEIG